LNRCRGTKPLASAPEGYAHSCFGGYTFKGQQVDWISCDEHHRFSLGLNGEEYLSFPYGEFLKAGLRAFPKRRSTSISRIVKRPAENASSSKSIFMTFLAAVSLVNC
jgi:hypothetical protein